MRSKPRVLVHLLLQYPEETFVEAMDGTDEANAMERARNRWPHAELRVLAVTTMDGRLV